MAGEQYIDKAVVSLAAYLRSNLATHLRAVETAQGLTINSLTDPEEVVEADADLDNRSPILQVWDEAAEVRNQLNKLWSVTCSVAISYTGDTPQSAEAFVRRYATAVIRCIYASETLSGTVSAAYFQGYSTFTRGDQSQTRKVSILSLDIEVYEGP